MTCRCIDCARFSMRSDADMAKAGFGICSADKPWRFYGARREWECQKFALADDETIRQRVEWLEAQRARKVQGGG